MLGRILLRYPRLARIRRVPLLGGLIRGLGRRMLPREELVWASIQAGPAKGLLIRLNPRTGSTYYDGTTEGSVQHALLPLLAPGAVFYDIGANVGFFTLLAARHVGPEGRVVSFEPDPEVAARLRENAERNGFRHIEVVEAAVWSASGRVPFARADAASSPDMGWGHVDPRGTHSVAAVSVDDLVRSGTPPPTVVKCDVEGAELEVLRGAAETLRKSRPALVIEIHASPGDVVARQCRELLAAYDYDLRPLDDRQWIALPR